jgi:hypothetical protein
MAGQAKASEKARLRRLNATAGKAWGSSSMYDKTSYPKKNAGTQREMTIAGGKGRRRPDRMATGGTVKRSSKKGHHTTNIVIAAPGGAGGRGVGVPAVGGGMPTRPPIAPGAPPVVPPVVPPRPMMGAPMGPMGPTAAMGAPMLPRPPIAPGAGMPPPGMKRGGVVKKRKIGGETEGKAYRGFPHSPTTEVDDAVSAHKRGGRVGRRQYGGTTKKPGQQDDDDDAAAEMQQSGGPPMAAQQALASSQLPSSMPNTSKRGGAVKKRQVGGGLFGMTRPGSTAMPAQPGPPTISGRAARPAQPLMVPTPANLAAYRTRPAPGTTVGFKKGGKTEKHGDEAEDKKLFKKLYKEEEAKEEKTKKRATGGSITNPFDTKPMPHEGPKPEVPPMRKKSGGAVKRAAGGFTPKNQDSTDPGLAGSGIYHQQGKGYARGGLVTGKLLGGAGSGLGRLRATKTAAKVPDKTEL